MTSYVLKYNTHERQRTAASADGAAAFLVRASLAIILLFLAIYVVEKDSLMLSERMTKLEEQKIILAEKNASDLEIRATQMAASYNLKEVASGQNMVLSGKVSYVNIEGDLVALAR